MQYQQNFDSKLSNEEIITLIRDEVAVIEAKQD